MILSQFPVHFIGAGSKLWDIKGKLRDKIALDDVLTAEKQPDVQTVPQAIAALQFNFRNQYYTGPGRREAAYDVFLAKGLVADMKFESPLPEGQPRNRTRYWLLNVDPHIINGHPDIWSYNAMNLYARLFRLCIENPVPKGDPEQ